MHQTNPAQNKLVLKLVNKKTSGKNINNVANTIKVNQRWKTAFVLDCFKSLFLKFDFVELYAPICEELLGRFISFIKSIATISNSVINIIGNSRKSLFYYNIHLGKGRGKFFVWRFHGNLMMELKSVRLLGFTCWND